MPYQGTPSTTRSATPSHARSRSRASSGRPAMAMASRSSSSTSSAIRSRSRLTKARRRSRGNGFAAVELQDRLVRRRRGVESDLESGRPARRVGSSPTDTSSHRRDRAGIAGSAGALQPGVDGGPNRLAQVARRGQRMPEQPVGDLAADAGHDGADGRQEDRRVAPLRPEGPWKVGIVIRYAVALVGRPTRRGWPPRRFASPGRTRASGARPCRPGRRSAPPGRA